MELEGVEKADSPPRIASSTCSESGSRAVRQPPPAQPCTQHARDSTAAPIPGWLVSRKGPWVATHRCGAIRGLTGELKYYC
jgi:hypothetical protein